MKELNIENYQAWVLEAFDLDKVAEDHEERPGDTWAWENCGGSEFDSLIYGPELISIFDIHFGPDSGLLIEENRYSKDFLANRKRVTVLSNPWGRPQYDWKWTLLKFVPENISELQEEAEYELEQKAKIDLKTWLEQESEN